MNTFELINIMRIFWGEEFYSTCLAEAMAISGENSKVRTGAGHCDRQIEGCTK